MIEDNSRGGESGLGEGSVPVGYSSHRGGVGLEVWDYQGVAITGHGGVISQGLQNVQRPRTEPQGTPTLGTKKGPSGGKRTAR